MRPEALLRHTAAAFEAEGIPYMLAGSLAAMAYGIARLTHDIDFVVDLTDEQIAALEQHFPEPEFYFDALAIGEAMRSHTSYNIIQIATGLKVDLLPVTDTAFAREEFSRRREVVVVPGLTTSVAAPEDVILMKLVFYQEGHAPKHVSDIQGMLQCSGDALDRAYLERWASRLGVAAEWQAVQTATGDGCL